MPAAQIFGSDEFQKAFNVSRETLDRLELYVHLLQKWSPRINLVGRNTLSQTWHRHLFDSAQLSRFIPARAQTLMDFGSGGGFPGLVLAIMTPHVHVTLVDSDKRKCVFLREVARQCATDITVLDQRIEDIPPQTSDIITARALASLSDLIGLTARFCGDQTISLYLKGQDVDKELTSAAKCWKIDPRIEPSQTDPFGQIVVLRGHPVKRDNC